jgi:hypothetical protein
MLTKYAISGLDADGQIVVTTHIDGSNERKARQTFAAERPDVKVDQFDAIGQAVESYEELVAWLKANNVTPANAQSCVQMMQL